VTPVYLAVEVLVFFAVIEHLGVVGVGKQLGAISEQDDFARPIAQASCSLIEVEVVVVAALIVRLTSTGTSELS
jgi:hypothetical protein